MPEAAPLMEGRGLAVYASFPHRKERIKGFRRINIC